MTIDEAIKVLQEVHRSTEFEWRADNVDALKLGIEALKEIKYLQRMDADFKDFMLPSESK